MPPSDAVQNELGPKSNAVIKSHDQYASVTQLILAIVALAVAFFYRTKPTPASAVLVPLGTNAAGPGTQVYNPANREEQIGTILESDNAYEFPTVTSNPPISLNQK